MNLLTNLTDAQRSAVEHVDGPLLVLAGPGSGKTTVVTRRVAYLLEQGIPAWQVLALTFTNKAAGEMRDRIERVLPDRLAKGLTATTFHAFCARLLRQYAGAAGISERFCIYDTTDQRAAVTQAMKRIELNSRNWTPASVLSAISGAKNQLLDAAAYQATAFDFYSRSIAKVYAAYERTLSENDALDFDDLLLKTARMLQNSAETCQELRERYRYIMIDEYQDTNHAQFVIANAIAVEHRNICVVGDPDQSIYGWRGADIKNILEFEDQYAGARTVILDENFRSTGHIVAVASALIANNKKRKPKNVVTNLEDGHKPKIIIARDEQHEAKMIVEEMRRRHEDDDLPWKEMAILYRVNALTRVLEEAFRIAQIPYVIARGTAFYDRKEIKDAVSYLRLILNPSDEFALRRVINEPTRGIGKTTLERIEAFAISRRMRMGDAVRCAAEVPGLTARAVKAATTFATMVDRWRMVASADTEGALRDLVEQVIEESGLEKHYRSLPTEEDQQRVENLAELISAAAQFEATLDASGDQREERNDAPADAPADQAPVEMPEVIEAVEAQMPLELINLSPEAPAEPDAVEDNRSLLGRLAAYLESVALVSDADAVDPERGSVTLMTLHAAKGLEFDLVAVAGLENGLLPHERSLSGGDDEMEEERRLCFVGITRARRHLLITRAAIRTLRGMRMRSIESPFLDELPAANVVLRDESGGQFQGQPQRRAGGAPWAGDDVWDPDAPKARSSRGSGTGYEIGCTVRHPTFGLGRIESLQPRPAGSAARVAFSSGDTRTLILEFAKLQRVD